MKVIWTVVFAMSALLMLGCASRQQPVLYPNAHSQSVGQAQIDIDVAEGVHIGFGDDNTPNRRLPKALNTGLTVIGKRARLPGGIHIGNNVIISPDVTEDAFQSEEIASGETV